MNESETETKDDEKKFVDMSEIVMHINGTIQYPTQCNYWGCNGTYGI